MATTTLPSAVMRASDCVRWRKIDQRVSCEHRVNGHGSVELVVVIMVMVVDVVMAMAVMVVVANVVVVVVGGSRLSRAGYTPIGCASARARKCRVADDSRR